MLFVPPLALLLLLFLFSCFIINVGSERASVGGGEGNNYLYSILFMRKTVTSASRMFYNYYFSLSFLCLAHFLLCSGSSSSHLAPSLFLLSLSLFCFRIYLFVVSFCAKVYTSFDFRSGFGRANSFRFCFFASRLLLLYSSSTLALSILFAQLASSLARHANSPRHSFKGFTCPPANSPHPGFGHF